MEEQVAPNGVEAVAAASLSRLHSLCGAPRPGLKASTEHKRATSGAQARIALSDSSLAVLELREVNRTIQDSVATLKGRARAPPNQEVDKKDLKLQALQYEKNYFLREIRHARDYPPDRPIDMLSKEAFVKAAPAGVAAEADDPHAFHLARLQLELDQRKSLCEQRDKLLASRKALEESIASRRAFLEGMGSQLASITRISRPLQDLLQQRLTTRWQESKQIKLLPPPLRVLFERALANRDTTLKALSVSVEGDLELAANLAAAGDSVRAGTRRPPPGLVSPTRKSTPSKRKKTTPVDGGGGDGGDGEAGEAGEVGDAGGNEAEDDGEPDDEALALHPLRLRVILPLPPPPDPTPGALPEGTRTLHLDFSCMTSTGIVAVKVTSADGSLEEGEAATKLTTKLFVNLLGADTGEELPEPTTPNATFSIAQQKEALLTLLPAVPFKWAQLLGGDPENIDLFGDVLSKLTERVRATDALSLQLTRLASLDASSRRTWRARSPRRTRRRLPSSRRGVHSTSRMTSHPNKRPSFQPCLRGSYPLSASSSRRSLGTRWARPLRASRLASSSTSLPTSPPRPRTSPSIGSSRQNALQTAPRGPPPALEAVASAAALRVAELHRGGSRDLALLQMESELNRPVEPPDELLQSDGIYSLSFAVQRAITLLDVYVETDGDGGGATAIRGTLASRRVRGRDRRRPFVFDPRSGQFDQGGSKREIRYALLGFANAFSRDRRDTSPSAVRLMATTQLRRARAIALSSNAPRACPPPPHRPHLPPSMPTPRGGQADAVDKEEWAIQSRPSNAGIESHSHFVALDDSKKAAAVRTTTTLARMPVPTATMRA